MTTSPSTTAAARAGHWELAGELRVARLGFGAMQLPGPGVWGPPKDREAAVAVLRRAVELGVTHLDTSDYYGPRVANELIREALHPYPEELLIATKVGVSRDQHGGWDPAATPTELRRQVEENLRRLGREPLDLVYLRVGGDGLLPPDETPLADSFQALADLRAQGAIRHLGLSGVTTEQLAEARRIAPVAAVENRFNLLDRSGARALEVCERERIAFVPYFPLGAGAVPLARERVLAEVAGRHGATVAQVAIAWLLARSPVILPIPGTSSIAHLEENVAAAALRLTDAEMAELDGLGAAA